MRSKIILLFLLMVTGLMLFSDAVIPGVINLEVKDEDNNAILSSTSLSCEVWLNTDYGSKITFSNLHVGFTSIGETAGLLTIDAKAQYPSSGPGDYLHVWVKYTGSGNQEGLIDIPLTNENTQEFVGNNALILTSSVATNTFAGEDLEKIYSFNPSRAAGSAIDCDVTVTLSSGSAGDVTIGLFNQKPGSVPLQGINFGIYFDTKALTAEGSGDHTINIAWSNAIDNLDTSSGVYGLYLSEDGTYWVNTYNVTYSGKSVYGTTDPSFTVNASTGNVSFDIDHIPHSIVFGNGDTGTTSYTETTPPQSAGIGASLDSNDLDLEWTESPQPGVTYDLQEYSGGSWTDMNVSGSITGTTTKAYTVSSAVGSDSKFYRTKVSNNSGQTSYSQVMGYIKNTLSASDWNLVGYSMGAESQTVSSLETEIGSSASIKIWNDTSQSWVVPNGSVTLSKGDVFLVDVNAETTWHSVGTAYPADGSGSYTWVYSSTSGSGYNPVILRVNKIIDGVDTISELYADIFDGSRGTDSYSRTISWFDHSTQCYTTYDDGPLSSYLGSTSINVGDAFIVHVGSSDNASTWSQ